MILTALKNSSGKPMFEDPEGKQYILSISQGIFFGLENKIIIPVNSVVVA